MADANSTKRGWRFKDLTGQRFARLVVLELDHMNRGAFWKCQCDCGNTTIVKVDQLTGGKTRSCGCWKIDNAKLLFTVHGKEPKDVFNIWCHIRRRCYDEQDANYFKYGARGITVCNRWLESFIDFRDDMGPRPSKQHSIERKDNNGPYCPDNCVWATKTAQARNRRSTVLVEYRGESRCVPEWAEILGINMHTLYSRIFVHKWDLERAMTLPLQPTRERRAEIPLRRLSE